MGNSRRAFLALAALSAAVLVVAGSCIAGLPGEIAVTGTSPAPLDGTTGHLNIEIREGSATGDLRGLWVEDDYPLDSANPFSTTMAYVSVGDHVVVAWLDVNRNRTLDTGDVIPSLGNPSITIAPEGKEAVTVDLDSYAP